MTAEATTVTTEYNFLRPDGSYGTAWTPSQQAVLATVSRCVDAMAALGVANQTIEVVTRSRTVSFSEESHFKSYPVGSVSA